MAAAQLSDPSGRERGMRVTPTLSSLSSRLKQPSDSYSSAVHLSWTTRGLLLERSDVSGALRGSALNLVLVGVGRFLRFCSGSVQPLPRSTDRLDVDFRGIRFRPIRIELRVAAPWNWSRFSDSHQRRSR